MQPMNRPIRRFGRKGPNGLDATKPFGTVVLSNGKEKSLDQLPWYVFVPVADVKNFLWLFSDPPAHTLLAPSADGTYKITTATEATLYLMFKGHWAYITDNRDHFKLIADHPDTLLGDLPKQYYLAARLSAKDLSPEMKRQCLDLLGVVPQGTTVPKAAGKDDVKDRNPSAAAGTPAKKIETFVNDLDEVLLGLNLGPKLADKPAKAPQAKKVEKTPLADKAARVERSLHVDCRITALPGTATAEWLAHAQKSVTTDFAGFCLPGASMALYHARMLEDKEVAQAKAWFARVRAGAIKELDSSHDLSKEQAEVAQALLSDVLQVLEKTVEAKKIDFGAAVLLDGDDSAIVAGTRLVDGDKLDKVMKRLLDEIVKEKPELAKKVEDVKTLSDLAPSNGTGKGEAKPLPAALAAVHFRRVTLPVNSDRLTMLFGNKVEVLLGIGPERLYLAVGRDAASLLKDSIVKSAGGRTQNSVTQISVAPAPLAEFLGETAGPWQREALDWSNVLAPNSSFFVTPAATPNGVNIQLKVEEGLLQPASHLLTQWASFSLRTQGRGFGIMQPGLMQQMMQQNFVQPAAAQPNRHRRSSSRIAPPPPVDSSPADTRSPF